MEYFYIAVLLKSYFFQRSKHITHRTLSYIVSDFVLFVFI